MGWAGSAQSHLLAVGAGVQQAGSTVLVLQKLSSLLSKSCFCLLLGGLGTPTLCSKLSSIRWGLRALTQSMPPPRHTCGVCVRVCVAGRRPTPCSSLEVQMAQRSAAHVTSLSLLPCWSHSLGEGVQEADLCRPHPIPEHPSAAGTQPPSSVSPGLGLGSEAVSLSLPSTGHAAPAPPAAAPSGPASPSVW